MLASVKGGDGFGRVVSGWRPLCVGDGSSNSLDRVDLWRAVMLACMKVGDGIRRLDSRWVKIGVDVGCCDFVGLLYFV